LKTFIFLAFTMLSACALFHSKKPPAPVPPEFIVTGAPAGSIVFVDDVQKGQLTALNDKPQIVTVTAGAHVVDVRVDGTVVYRENTFIKSGERRVVTVLSGSNRE
jgi:hypothetical protein